MEEKELIAKIRELRQIKPNREWVFLTKNQIFGSSSSPQKKMGMSRFFVWLVNKIFPFRMIASPRHFLSLFGYKNYKLALLVLAFLVIFISGLLTLAQNSLPGEILYSIKKITEKSQAIFVSEEEKPKLNLELTNKRLEELNKIAETNQVKKLAPAIKEVQTSLSQVSKNLVKSKKVDKETVDRIVNLKKNLEKAETSLSTKIGSQEDEENIESWTKEQVEILIKDLENSTLTEKQEEILNQMKKLAAEEKYAEALELYLLNQ